MKKHILMTATVLTLVAGSLLAQNEDVLRPNGKPGDVQQNNKRSSSNRDKMVLGVEGGGLLSFFSQTLERDVQVTGSPEDVLKSASGWGTSYGLFLDIPLSSSFGFQFRGNYNRQSFSSSSTADTIDASIVGIRPRDRENPQGDEVVPMPVQTSVAWTTNSISIAALARIVIVDELFLTVGPIASIRMGDVVRHDEIKKIETDTSTWISIDYNGIAGRYQTISRDVSVATNVLPVGAISTSTYAAARFGLEAGIGYCWRVGPTAYIAPNVRYQYMFSNMNETYQSTDESRSILQRTSNVTYSNAMLNALAIVLQVGFYF